MPSSSGSNCQKRKHQDDSDSDTQEIDTKRVKRGPSYYPPCFWDTLSKVRLTRRTLKEFDRRTAEESRNQEHHISGTAGSQAVAKLRLLRSDTLRLRRIADKGGLNLDIIRGVSDVPTMPKSQTSSRSSRRNDPIQAKSRRLSKAANPPIQKTITPYSAEFEQKMIDKGVFPPVFSGDGRKPPKPNNLAEMQEVLSRPRPSLSPSTFSETAFEAFQENDERAKTEMESMVTVIPLITGPEDQNHHTGRDVPFSQLEPFDKHISSAKPDIYYGAQAGKIDVRVRRQLKEYIIPSSYHSRPAAPSFFFEGKGEQGRSDVAKRQVMYDGAIGARGMLHLQNFGNSELVYDGNAYTMSATYMDGLLKLYATHLRPSDQSGRTEYYLTQLDTFGMTGNARNFLLGAAAYRNAREWTEEQRNRFITAANAAAQRMSDDPTSSSQPASPSVQIGAQHVPENSELQNANLPR